MPGIEHVVVLMMENRSFDEYFGTFPGVAGFYDGSPSIAQPWPTQPDGVLYPWRRSTFTSNGLITPGLGHDWIIDHVAANVVAPFYDANNQGLFQASSYGAQSGQPVAMGCFLADDIPYHWALAQNFALCDHYFCSVLGGTLSNRMYLAGGTICDPKIDPVDGVYQGSEPPGGPTSTATDPVTYNNALPAAWPNYLADLWQRGISYRVYDDWQWQFDGAPPPPDPGDLNPFPYYQTLVTPSGPVPLGVPGDDNYFAPSSTSTLPDQRPLFAQHVNPNSLEQNAPFLATLTWIMPPYNYSEHPTWTSADGAYYTAQIVDALMQSEYWESTVLVITYDENDCHFDHLPPPVSPDPRAQPTPNPYEPWVYDDAGVQEVGTTLDYPVPVGAGLRVPAIIVSPWTYQRGIISDQMDHTSILQLMEEAAGVPCSTLPAAGSPTGWRRATFASLYDVVDPDNHAVVPSVQITGLPTAVPTVLQWQANANNRNQRQTNQPVPPQPQPGPPIPQSCAFQPAPDSFSSEYVLGLAAGQASVTIQNAITVVVTGFQAQEFIDLDAGVPPPASAADLPEVPVEGGGTCRTRVPVPQFVSGESPGEFVIGPCSQVSSDPNGQAGDDAPLELTFMFPLTFTRPWASFAFRQGTVRMLQLVASFTVDATVNAQAQLILTGGTLVLHQLADECLLLAEELAAAERAYYEAQQIALEDTESGPALHAMALALGQLQALYQRRCGSGGTSGPVPPFYPGITG
jgi:phospholipase C